MQPQRSNGAPPPAASGLPDGARLAAAPISWGVCEVPGSGVKLLPGRVLGEMAALGARATEDGFVPVVPHEPSFDAAARETARVLAASAAAASAAAAGAAAGADSDGRTPPVTVADARAPLVIGLAAWRSLREGRPVRIADVEAGR